MDRRIIEELLREKGSRELLKAICRQWLADGRPAYCEKEIKRYAKMLEETGHKRVKEWYNQARRVE